MQDKDGRYILWFKQKTAYELRMSDWSSDVCSSDLLKAEFNPTPHLRGTLSMARAQSEDSANSQFFIMFQPRFSLDRRYTVFGRVVSWMQYFDAIHKGEPPAEIGRASCRARVCQYV